MVSHHVSVMVIQAPARSCAAAPGSTPPPPPTRRPCWAPPRLNASASATRRRTPGC
ncbi:hypothetical protein [Acrocarpospora sp. B8E8]|uniref:hypothetical protein n=1 Tax=Acrocarpospora sp. B8E8 TaxID=3153572 RepID=UPI00325E756B